MQKRRAINCPQTFNGTLMTRSIHICRIYDGTHAASGQIQGKQLKSGPLHPLHPSAGWAARRSSLRLIYGVRSPCNIFRNIECGLQVSFDCLRKLECLIRKQSDHRGGGWAGVPAAIEPGFLIFQVENPAKKQS